MKNKKVLSLLLSVAMLIGSVPAVVLAQGDEGEGADPALADTQDAETDGNDAGEDPESGDPGEGDPILGTIPENSAFTVGQMAEDSVRHYRVVPSSTGRYGFLCADGRDMSVTFKSGDETVSPMESVNEHRYVVQYYNLEAGKEYEVEIREGSYATYPDYDVYCYICPMSDTIPFGESDIFVRGYDYNTQYTFIPQTSGIYVFEFTGEEPITAYIDSFEGTSDEIYDRLNGNIIAKLEAGVPYDINLSYGLYDKYTGENLTGVVHVNISGSPQMLGMNENVVELKPEDEVSFFRFIPKDSGVYEVYSEGSCDTWGSLIYSSNDDGKGENFKTGAYLQEGKTYILEAGVNGVWQSVTVPIYVERAEQIQIDQEYSFESIDGDAYYYEFTATENGWYYIDSRDIRYNIRVFDIEHNDLGSGSDSWYMKAGSTCTVVVKCHVNSKDPGKFSVHRVSQELELQTPATLAAKSSQYDTYLATFTAEESGVYVFTSEQKTETVYFGTEKHTSVRTEYSNGKMNISIFLSAGTTYFLRVMVPEDFEGDYDVTVKKQEAAVEEGVNYPVDFPMGVSHNYTFTPSTSGYYLVGLMNATSYYAPVVTDGSKSINVEYPTYDSNFSGTLVKLEAGKTYGIAIQHQQEEYEEMYWFIQYLESLTPGTDIEVPIYGRYAYCTFTPSESGVYTFSSDKFSQAFCEIKTYDAQYNSLEQIASSRDSLMIGSVSAVLEEGKTYVFEIGLYSADTSLQMDLVKEQALSVGEHTVSIVDRNSAYTNQKYAIFSFTPEQDGLYEFTSHALSENDDPEITIYEFNPMKVDIARDGTSGEENNFKLETLLEAGKTYYVVIHDYIEYDLPIEIRKIEQMESRLEGYSLSLDGSIAVNLYMSLSDQVTESNTAVLQFTCVENGTTVSYSMKQADIREVRGKRYYVFHLPVAAKEMTYTLKAQIVDPASGFTGKEYTFSVREYAEQVLYYANEAEWNGKVEYQEYLDAKPLVVALLNYGAAAQKYFGVDEYNLANGSVEYKLTCLGSVPTSTLPQYNSANEKLPEDVTFVGASLTLESETALTFYFSAPSGLNLSFTDGKGTPIAAGSSGNYITVRVTDISADKLGENITVKIVAEGDAGEYSVIYNPMTYCYNVLTRPLTATRTQNLKDLMKAFYFYNQAAVKYMATKGNE